MCLTVLTELRIGVTEDSQWETRPYTDEVQKAICEIGTGGPYVSYITPCTTANHNSDVALEYIDWQWAFCVPKMYFVVICRSLPFRYHLLIFT